MFIAFSGNLNQTSIRHTRTALRLRYHDERKGIAVSGAKLKLRHGFVTKCDELA